MTTAPPRFRVTEVPFDHYSSLRLTDSMTGESTTILPWLGGTVNSLILAAGPRLVEVLDGYSSAQEAANPLASSFKGSNLFPFPNRIAGGSYLHGGRRHQLHLNFPHENNAIHGLVYDQEFHVTDRRDGDHGCLLTLECRSDGHMGYPFSYRLLLEFTLTGKDGFTCTCRVTNESDTAIPVGHGWHPYLTAGAERIDDLLLQFPAREILAHDKVNIPTGQATPYTAFNSLTLLSDTTFDDCFRLDGTERAEILLKNRELDLTLRLWQELGRSKYNFLQIYTPPHRRSIAIEPMTCAPDAFNNGRGLILLEPGNSFSSAWGVQKKPA